MRPLRPGSPSTASWRSIKRPRISLLAALGIAAISVTGCGSSDDAAEGLPVRLVNESAWDAQVVGCPPCKEGGVLVGGDPDRTPGDSGGEYIGWTEERAWPVTYKVVVQGVESTCPVIDPGPGKTGSAAGVGTRDIIYAVDETGKCVAGSPGTDGL
ncbi:hypothetical protein ABZ612_40885 [Streptomyces avermitilis]|uniref:hypothetical protein n=1 Tax=Streptomyces avermitilis TaxID=33903 RepID=UPI0033CCA68B